MIMAATDNFLAQTPPSWQQTREVV